ncbi:MAG: efflux RND transporter periplasmic adaptor subunit [Gammaproteobacteria bacterium]
MDKEEALASLKSPDRPAEHPQARRSGQAHGSRGRLLRFGGGVILLALIAALLWIFIPDGSSPSGAPPKVRLLRLSGTSATTTNRAVLSAAGYVVARRETTVSSRITGMIRAVYVQEGMAVRHGQILARLAARTTRANVLLARRQLRADQALVESAQTQLALDRKTWVRIRTIFRQGLESRSALDAAQAAVALDQAGLLHDQAEVAAARSELALAEIILGHTVIRAPFTGIVTAKYAHRGEMISPAAVGGFTKTGICELVDMQSLEMDVDVNESFIDRVHEGEPARVVLNAYPDWNIPAHVISVVPTANKNKGTVKVRVAFQHLDPRILPEMAGEVYFYSKTVPPLAPSGPVALPRHAVFNAASQPFVFLDEGGHAVRARIQVLPHKGSQQIFVTGLPGGARVIISWSSRIHDGERVNVRHRPA